jgi:acyl-CoA synthetase (AMP-forming)/AMP-acid ligase II
MKRTPVHARIHDYLEHWASAASDREALAMGNVRFTYRQLASRVDKESQALWRLGLRPGGMVAVICPARPEFFATFLAIVSVGGVFQGLSPKSALPELIYQVGDASPALIVWHGDDRNGAIAEQVAKEVGHDPRVVSGRDLAGAHESATTGAAVAAVAKQVSPEHPAAIVYTSGTTGRPKGALLPHVGFTSCSVVQAIRWVGERTPRMPCVEPINHVAAVGDACVAMLVAGGTVVFQEQFHAEQMLELLTAEHINLWYTDPAVLSLCSRSSAWERTDLSGLDRVCWSGGRAPLSLVRELGERVPLRGTSWGMTETVGSLTYTDDDASDAVLASTIGCLDRAYDGRVLLEDGSPARAGETGELQVRGPHIIRGYWRRPDATAEAFTADGWFRTGDLVMPWDDGNLELVGRRSEMFKSGGENIYPREVENALESHPAVSAGVVVPRPDDLWGEVGHAYIVARGELVEDELREHVRARLARFKVPKAFTFVAEFPLLGSGKIDRRALRDKAGEGTD